MLDGASLGMGDGPMGQHISEDGISRFGGTRTAWEPLGPHPGLVLACDSLGAGSKGRTG